MKFITLTLFAFLIGFNLQSEQPKVYGKLWISIESQDTASGTEVDMVSNASRLGIKGSMDFGEGIEAIYQAEYEVDPVDGTADESKDRTFKPRNSFVGLKGSMGTIFLGTHDTATKRSLKKIDLFNDLAPDIKNVLQGENRLEDFVGFTTPKYMGKISATFNSIKNPSSSGNNYSSYSVNYSNQTFQAALAIDESMKGYDGTRVAILIPFSRSQIGLLIQKTTKLLSSAKKNGYVISFSRKIASKGTLKFQYASSSMKIDSGKQTSIGYDFRLKKNLKFFTFYSRLDASDIAKEKDIFSAGLEYNY